MSVRGAGGTLPRPKGRKYTRSLVQYKTCRLAHAKRLGVAGIVRLVSGTAHQPSVQLSLFPVDDEERVLLAQGRLYQALPEVGQQLVRAYLRMMRAGAGCRQADWIRETGLPGSTAHDAIKRHEAVIWPVIMEACQLLGVRGAQVGGMALVAAGVLLFRELIAGRRSTSTLTPVELSIMRDCAAMSGVRLPGASVAGITVTTADGTRVEASTVQAPSEDMARAILADLRARADRTRGADLEAGGTDSLRTVEVRVVPAPADGDRGADPGRRQGFDASVAVVSLTVAEDIPGTEWVPEMVETDVLGSSVVSERRSAA